MPPCLCLHQKVLLAFISNLFSVLLRPFRTQEVAGSMQRQEFGSGFISDGSGTLGKSPVLAISTWPSPCSGQICSQGGSYPICLLPLAPFQSLLLLLPITSLLQVTSSPCPPVFSTEGESMKPLSKAASLGGLVLVDLSRLASCFMPATLALDQLCALGKPLILSEPLNPICKIDNMRIPIALLVWRITTTLK